MSLTRFLAGSIFVMAAIACGLGAMIAWQKWSQIQDIETAALRLGAIRGISTVTAALNSERGVITLMLGTISSGDQSQDANLADRSKLSDGTFEEAKVRVAALVARDPESSPLVDLVDNARREWQAARQACLKIISQTSVDNRADALTLINDKSATLNAAIILAMRQQSRQLAAVDGEGFRYNDLAGAISELRDVGGQQAGLLKTLVTTAKPISDNDRMNFVNFEGRVQQTWVRIVAELEQPTIPVKLKTAITTVKDVYIDGFGATKAALAANFSSGKFQLDGIAYQKITNVVWASVVALRDAAYDAAAVSIDGSLARSKQGLIIAILAIAVAVAASLGVSALVFVRVSRPLTAMARNIDRIAGGNLDEPITGIGRRDEIGGIAAAVGIFRDGLIRNRELEADAERRRIESEQRRRELQADWIAQFEASVGTIVDTVATNAHDLETAANLMNSSVRDSSRRSSSVAAISNQVASNVTAVAGAMEELGSSVQEISRQVQHSSDMSRAAVEEARQTAEIVRELSQGASRISDVLGLISTIASQTNLLALNATIEAARAGESGRGFAVVAAEVKELANQTAKATADISGQINAIQTSTDRAVAAIQSIAGTIQTMNSVTATISAAVDQQGSATREIVVNVSDASNGTSDVTQNVAGVAASVLESGSAAERVLTSSSQLALQANQLRSQIATFLNTIRAA